MSNSLINIEVAYATATQQKIIALQVPENTHAEKAIELSKIKSHFLEHDFNDVAIGIFGKVCQTDTVLKQGDRVEIYRTLVCDPKQARRNRAIKQT